MVALGGEARSAGRHPGAVGGGAGGAGVQPYGPTETTIAVTHIELTPELVADGTVPIGTLTPA